MAGEVHALLGENGAGKSTLSNILTGLYRQDVGTVEIGGKKVEFNSPRDALNAGIGMVHQHFRLVSTFTVAENVVLGESDSSLFMDQRQSLREYKNSVIVTGWQSIQVHAFGNSVLVNSNA